MSSEIRVSDVSKVFKLADGGGRAVSLREALLVGGSERSSREVRALEGISFEIREGERVGIIGRNGAGKSTLLSLLAGLTQPTTGDVDVRGDVHAMLTIGTVLREDLTGRENIQLDASVHGRSHAEISAVAEQIIAFAELGKFIERPVRTYSSGMKARLAFSMGAFINSDILIIDETLAVGDVFFAEKAMRRMKEMTASGRIVIMVTHALASIVSMCSRCLWLDEGRLVMDGDPETVTRAYDTAVREADEEDLARKFGKGLDVPSQSGETRIERVVLRQENHQRQTTLTAMMPLEIEIAITCGRAESNYDLVLSIQRVDGRVVWLQSTSQWGCQLHSESSFTLRVSMDPFLLGADLYRLDVALMDGQSLVVGLGRVFEVIDEHGQFGGKPMLFYPPRVCVKPLQESSQ